MSRFLIGVFSLLVVVRAGAAAFISEFMASNDGTLADEDGAYSDWVEIHNPDAEPVNLDGWHLTDNASNLTKWRFPAVEIPPKGYLVVFCSNKDRRIPGQELHTNFALGAGGEYLGLIASNGVTKVSEFAPEFPEQFEDVSYGVSSGVGTVVIAQDGTPLKILVPTNGDLGTTWRERTFDDSGWTSGQQPVGFFNVGKTSNPDLSDTLRTNIQAQMAGQARGAYLRIAFDVPDPADVDSMRLRMKFDDGFAAFVNGQWAGSGNSPAVNALAFNSFASGVHNPNTFEDYDLTNWIPHLVAGTNVVAIHGMNESATSSDAYFLAELAMVGDVGAEPVTGYFFEPTPGARNGGPDSARLPQTVAFSRPAGTFTSAFPLTMSGASTGQEIRYNIAPPSAPFGDLAEPTAESTVYTGPVTITASRLIRAAVFDSESGQRGTPATTQYLLLETGGSSNTSSFTSTLPIVVADSHGGGAPNATTYKTSMFHLFEPAGSFASLDSTPSLFSRAGLRVRGSSSASFPKKSYRMETWSEWDQDTSRSVLGMAADGDWILTGTWGFDDTYIHNAFAFELSRRMGRWAPRTQFVEMFFNSNGGKLDYTDYAGIYVLTERLESKSSRVDIVGIEPWDITGDALTGGYIFKIDRADADEVSWQTSLGIPNQDSGQSLVIVEPDADADTSEQVDYLQGLVQTFEDALHSERSAGFPTRNYRRFIDVPSWIDHHILSTIAYDVDALRLSAFFHKDRNAKIKAGPAWDFDRSLGSDDGRDVNPRSWNAIDYYFTRDWWGYLFQDPEFVQAWVDRWWQLRGNVLSNENLNALADNLGAQIGDTIGARDAVKWPGTGRNGNTPVSGSHSGEIARMKNWLASTTPGSLGRAPWLDTQIPGSPSASLDSGVVAPGAMVSLGGGGTIRYRTDGVDPRPIGGGVNGSSTVYSDPLTINETTVLRARKRSASNYNPFPAGAGTNWSAPLLRVYLVNEVFAEAGDIEVSEIHFQPVAPSDAEKAAVFEPTANDFEFLELKNVGNRVVNTFEMRFVQGKPFKELTLAPLTLAPGEMALVVRDREAFEARYGSTWSDRIVGEWGRDGALSNDGEEVQLLARDGSVVQTMTYEPGIPAGASLNLVDGAWRGDAPSPGSFGPTYSQWTSHYFPNGGEDGEPDADPDNDRAKNRKEYTRGTNPLVADALVALDPRLEMINDGTGRNYRFRYQRPVNRPDAQFQAEKTTDFLTWTPMDAAVTSTADGLETREAIVSIDEAGEPAALFLRVRSSIAE